MARGAETWKRHEDALDAARVEGMREARNAVEKCSSYEDRALYLHAIDARISAFAAIKKETQP